MTPEEMAETLEARVDYLSQHEPVQTVTIPLFEWERTLLALRGAADMLRLIHEHEMKRAAVETMQET